MNKEIKTVSERTEEEYKLGKKVIEALTRRGVIPESADYDKYMNIWEAVFEIIEEVKSNE